MFDEISTVVSISLKTMSIVLAAGQIGPCETTAVVDANCEVGLELSGEGAPDLSAAVGTGDGEQEWTAADGFVVQVGARDGEVWHLDQIKGSC